MQAYESGGNAPMQRDSDDGRSAAFNKRVLVAGITLGVLLRLVAVIYGDIGIYVDGVARLARAVRWAEHPAWDGLSGVWPPAHWYALGTLITVWNEPILLAKAFNFTFGIGSLFAFRWAVRKFLAESTANLSLLLLAIYWTHIWLTSSYWVEVPYLFFLFLAICYSLAAQASGSPQKALAAGFLLGAAMLLRNEALAMFLVSLVWYVLQVRRRIAILAFAVIPFAVLAWYLIEPSLHGSSYLQYFFSVKQSKQIENVYQGVTLTDCLSQWVLMLGASPTVFIVAPGLYGLWRFRHLARRDLFAWMFITQVTFYFSLTLLYSWRPQLRYLMLYFVNLFPYTALVWLQVFQKFTRRALPLLLVLTIAVQGAGWWAGRNNRLQPGWLPIQVRTASQTALDEWIRGVQQSGQTGLKIKAIVPGPLNERWSLDHSFVVNHIRSEVLDLEELHVQADKAILEGQLPERAFVADLILIDPQAVYYPAVINTLTRRIPGVASKQIHSHIIALLLSERARTFIKADSTSTQAIQLVRDTSRSGDQGFASERRRTDHSGVVAKLRSSELNILRINIERNVASRTFKAGDEIIAKRFDNAAAEHDNLGTQHV